MSEKYTDIPRVVLPPPEPGRASNVPRTIGYTLAVLFWVLCVPMLASGTDEWGRDPAYDIGAVMGAAGLPLLLAAAIRFVYVKLRKRRFLSPWLFFVAGVIAVLAIIGGRSAEQARVNEAAVERGLAADTAAVTPVDRCVTRMLEEADREPWVRETVFPGGSRSIGTRICARAYADGVLTTGGVPQSELAFKQSACFEGALLQFEATPRSERGLRRGDFEIYGRRYCAVILHRGLDAPGTPRAKLDAAAQSVLRNLVRSGQITPIR
jgi:hypothetical protein